MGCAPSKNINKVKKFQKQGDYSSSDHDVEKERERILNERLNEDKKILHEAAIMLIDHPTALDEYDEIIPDATIDHAAAIKKEKKEKRKNAKLLADKEQKWMLFNNVDIFDEDEMNLLSNFMEIILRNLPEILENYEVPKVVPIPLDKDMKRKSQRQLFDIVDDEDDVIQMKTQRSELTLTSGSHLNSLNSNTNIIANPKKKFRSMSDDISDDVITATRHNSIESLVRLDKISLEAAYKPQPITPNKGTSKSTNDSLVSINQLNSNSRPFTTTPISIEITEDNMFDYELAMGKITLTTVSKIIQLYKLGGKLCIKSVHKLLRLSHRLLIKLPNTSHIEITSKDKLTVVGDIHGQLLDLLHILDESGLPNNHHKYLFNGDFVDRGNYSVEVMCVLLSLFIACPNYVYFNRGNHEDFAICSFYGFQTEVADKYDDVTFGMFLEIFNYIPLYAIINNKVIVLHGGLFHSVEVTLAELNEIPRYDYSLLDMPEGGELIEPYHKLHNKQEFYRQLQRDTLWSDPKTSEGIDYNLRGAGKS